MALTIPSGHVDALVQVLTRQASDPFSTPQEIFRNLLQSAHLPVEWTRQVAGRFSGNPDFDAQNLVDWAVLKDVNLDDTRFTALGSLLIALLKKRPPPKKRVRY